MATKVAMVNMRSGNSDDCRLLLERLRALLGSDAVFVLGDATPVDVLERVGPTVRDIVVAGGDGTVAWVLASLDEFVWPQKNGRPAVAVVPLGTGNDLSRALGWGGGFTSSVDVGALLAAMDAGRVARLDRWRLHVVGLSPSSGDPVRSAVYTMSNYLSMGCDAAVCKAFHELRESLPALCSSRLGNKVLYTLGGTKAFFEEHVPLDKALRITVDGGRRLAMPPDIYGLMLLNISSYAGGADLFGRGEEPGFVPQSFGDGLLELVGVTGTFNLGAAACGLAQGVRLAQGREFGIEFVGEEAALWYQLDGEPSAEPLTAPSVIRVRLLDTETRVRVAQ